MLISFTIPMWVIWTTLTIFELILIIFAMVGIIALKHFGIGMLNEKDN